jgi:hypothetical protein
VELVDQRLELVEPLLNFPTFFLQKIGHGRFLPPVG